MFTQDQKTGLCGERWVCAQFEQRKYRARMLPDFFHTGADLIIEEQMFVEVKYARITGRGRQLKSGRVKYYPRWQWDVSNVNEQRASCLILVAEDLLGKCFPFIMPSWIMFDRSQFQITSHPDLYKGLISDFLHNWDVAKFLLGRGYKRDGQRQWWEVNNDAK